MRAHTDMNVVQTGQGRFIEVQGTAEHAPFDRDELNALLDLAATGNAQLAALQRRALEATGSGPLTVSSETAVPAEGAETAASPGQEAPSARES